MEDIALMRAIPTMAILQPADATETENGFYKHEYDEAVYLRLGRLPVADIYDDKYSFEIEKIYLKDEKMLQL